MIKAFLTFVVIFALLAIFAPKCTTESVKTVSKHSDTVGKTSKKAVKSFGKFLADM